MAIKVVGGNRSSSSAGFALRPPENTSLRKTHCSVLGVVLRCCPREGGLLGCLWVKLRGSFRVGAWNVLSLKDGDGSGICLGDGQTEVPGVPVESGCSDVL